MNQLLQIFLKNVPMELRYLSGLVICCMPVMLLRSLIPTRLYPALLAGISAAFAAFYLARKIILVMEKRQGAQLDEEIGVQTSGPSRLELAEKEKEFRQKWLDGIEKLKKAKISLYQLPWYIILGEPGGGKTMTLLNSGMDFPMGKDELPGFGGTRNYNWWFTNTAVILDTAGRLVFEQEGTTDRHEWESFLKLLKKRRRCPINGVVVALPVDKLMNDSAEQRHRNASIIRDRLRQVQNALGVRFPVFLLITKADLVAGFTEFYNELDSLQRNQMFGWSRPGDFSAPYDPKEFSQNFEELYQTLNNLRLKFLARKAGDIELGWVYTYPEAFRSLKGRVQDYIDVIFSQNIFAEPLFFRGFYFTSALQEGKPIIDILGQHLSDENLESLEGIFPQSRAFFIHDFYTQKVAKEQGMVFRSQKHVRRMRLLKNSTLYIGLPMLLVFLVMTFLGYRTYNATVSGPRATLAEATTLIKKYKTQFDQDKFWTVEIPADKSQSDLAKAIQLSQQLEQSMEAVKHPTGLASMMFASIGEDAEKSMRAVQRELIGYCILRPEIARVEESLSNPTLSVNPQNMQDWANSLAIYIQWHFNQGANRTLEDFRKILPDSTWLNEGVDKQLKYFIKSSTEGGLGGKLAAGLTANRNHQKKIIDAALNKAEAYWLGTTELDRGGSYNWWATLIARCQEARDSYTALVDFRKDFDRARRRTAFQEAAQQWISLFPQPLDTTTNSESKNTQLFQLIRDHLQTAPRTESGQITPLSQMINENLQTADRFADICLGAIPSLPVESDSDYAQTLSTRISELKKTLRQKMESSRSSNIARISELEGLLEPHPPQAPKQYKLTPAAEEAEKILKEVAGMLKDLPAEIEPNMDSWGTHLKDMMAQQTPDTSFDLDREWRPADLKKLMTSVTEARQRYELQILTEDIRKMLDPLPEQGLAKYMDGEDDDDRAKTLRFDGLKNRHAATFMTGVVKAKHALKKMLDEAGQKELLVDGNELNRLLDEGARQYIQHYVSSWASAYENYRLDPLASGELPTDWDGYRQWLRKNSEKLQKDYEEHLDAILTHVIEPFRTSSDPVAQELAQSLTTLQWPAGNSLEKITGKLLADPNAQIPPSFQTDWSKYADRAKNFQLKTLEELSADSLTFPQLTTTTNILSQEKLTQQMQYVVDLGQWILWNDIYALLESKYLQTYTSAKPFIFEEGSDEKIDPLQLKATLAALAQLQSLNPATPANSTAQQARQKYLQTANAWYQLMGDQGVEFELSYIPSKSTDGDSKQGPDQYYSQVALRLPGIQPGEGGADKEIAFEVAQAAPAKAYRWKPADGTLAVFLRGQTAQSQRLNAEMEPRVLEFQHASLGLLWLVLKFGQPSGETPDTWLIQLSKKVNEITGLENESAQPAEIGIAFQVKFIQPNGGLPARLGWPTKSLLAGDKPVLPGPTAPNSAP